MMLQRTTRAGFGLALVSAATFGTSGTFARSLIDTGWSPAPAVPVRISLAALILAIPALLALRGRWNVLRRNVRMVAIYGLVAVAGCQVFYFNAVQHLSVGVALLLEYMGIILIVGWLWIRNGQRPRRLTIAGSVAGLIGLVFVLNLVGDTHIDTVGVLWGLGAAVGLAVFFVLSATSDSELPALAMASGGMAIGAVTLLVLGAFGALPMQANVADVDIADHQVSWLVPVIGLSLVAAAIAYVAGIAATRILGSKLASFVGLTEVLFAVMFAWLLLGEMLTAMQLLGGVLIVAGWPWSGSTSSVRQRIPVTCRWSRGPRRGWTADDLDSAHPGPRRRASDRRGPAHPGRLPGLAASDSVHHLCRPEWRAIGGTTAGLLEPVVARIGPAPGRGGAHLVPATRRRRVRRADVRPRAWQGLRLQRRRGRRRGSRLPTTAG